MKNHKKRNLLLSLILAAVCIAFLLYVDKFQHYSMLAQVLCEHTYSLLIGLLLARCSELSLDGRLKQTLVGIGYGCRHLIRTLPSATH